MRVHAWGDERSPAIGDLHVHRARGAVVASTFVYDPVWVASPGAFDLDPATPRGTGPVQTPQGQALPGALADCTSDRWGRELRRREERRLAQQQERAVRSLDDLDFLVGVRDDLRQGDLRIAVDGTFERDGGDIPVEAQLGELLELADRAQADEITAAELAQLVRQGSSLGGARPKAHVRDAQGRIAIAKLPSAAHDTWDCSWRSPRSSGWTPTTPGRSSPRSTKPSRTGGLRRGRSGSTRPPYTRWPRRSTTGASTTPDGCSLWTGPVSGSGCP